MEFFPVDAAVVRHDERLTAPGERYRVDAGSDEPAPGLGHLLLVLRVLVVVPAALHAIRGCHDGIMSHQPHPDHQGDRGPF